MALGHRAMALAVLDGAGPAQPRVVSTSRSRSTSSGPPRVTGPWYIATLLVPKTSSEPLDQDFLGVAMMTKMERGSLLPLHRLLSSPPTAPPLTPPVPGPGRRGCHAPPRGRGPAPPGRSSRSQVIGPGSPGGAEPAALGGSPGSASSSGPRPSCAGTGPGATALGPPAPTARPPRPPDRHGLGRAPPGPREPDLGLSARPRGAGHDGRSRLRPCG